MNICQISRTILSYRLVGPMDKPLVVIESMLGGSSAEWRHLAEAWSGEFQVLTYDRAGYGESTPSSLPRSPENIAHELKELLVNLNLNSPAILVGHSMGGLYVQQFARLFPERVKAVILLDPVSAKNYTFRERMNVDEYARSGFNKTTNIKTGSVVTGLGLGFLLKPLLKQAPPFYYFKGFSKDAGEAIMKNLTSAKMYKTALSEYAFIDHTQQLASLEEAEGFPDIPVVLVCHCPDTMIAEIEKYGGADHATSARLDKMWIETMKEYLTFSKRSTFLQSVKSSHYLHLSDPEIIWQALKSLN